MVRISRRNLIKFAGAAPLAGLAACSTTSPRIDTALATPTTAKRKNRVVVIGGGFGGATAAKYLKKFDPDLDVTLIEYNRYYTTCAGSNWVIGGLRHVDSITFSYDKLSSLHGINVVQAWVKAIDVYGQNIRLEDGTRIEYDRLIVSPGIDLKFESVEGYDPMDVNRVPHAWKSGIQVAVLRQQLMAMANGGTVVISAPAGTYRCPPGPYERASLIAHYLKKHKPKSKIILLDAKTSFPKQALFEKGWQTLYGYGTENSMIDWVPAPDGELDRIDVRERVAYAGDAEDAFRADVLNVIPPQQAAHIAVAAHLTDDTGWCPVNPATAESTLVPNVHIIGDAAKMSPMPKSGFSANSQAKVCAAAIVALLNNKEVPPAHWINTCYSLVGPKYGISTAMVYKADETGSPSPVAGAGGDSPLDANVADEALNATSWWYNITQDMFG